MRSTIINKEQLVFSVLEKIVCCKFLSLQRMVAAFLFHPVCLPVAILQRDHFALAVCHLFQLIAVVVTVDELPHVAQFSPHFLMILYLIFVFCMTF